MLGVVECALEARAGGVFIEALGDLGFEADGRLVDRITLNPAVGGELRFGGHRLTISKDGDAIAISVERVGSVADSTDEKDVSNLFQLKRRAAGPSSIGVDVDRAGSCHIPCLAHLQLCHITRRQETRSGLSCRHNVDIGFAEHCAQKLGE